MGPDNSLRRHSVESTNTVNFVLSGLGGQGILFMTKILAQAALRKGLPVMGAETHGMAQRGGSVISHLRIGHVESSLVRAGTARFLLALDESEAYRSLAFLGAKGTLFANAAPDAFPRAEVKAYLEKAGIACHAANVSDIAFAMGTPMSSNLALLGFFSAFEEGPFSRDELRASIYEASPERFRKLNSRVFEAGFDQAKKIRA
jgi:indolepyruvate ferredoxin oxidoreductase beta subunit